MDEVIKKYEKIIDDVEKDINQAEQFIKDLYDDYDTLDNISKEKKCVVNLDDRIKVQSMILKISDYISNKRISKVEIIRQLNDLKAEIANQVKEGE